MAEGSSQSKRDREEIDDGGDSGAILKSDSGAILKSVKQSWIPCDAEDKLLHILALLKKNLVQKKVLLFANTVPMGYKLKLFLEKFAIKAAVLFPGLPLLTRMRTVEEFNAGSLDYLIAIHNEKADTLELEAAGENVSDRVNTQLKQMLNDRFGVVIGSELKNVYTVIHFQMPQTSAGYIHRIGRTGRESNTRASVSVVSPDEMDSFKKLKSTLAVYSGIKEEFIVPSQLLKRDVVESFRYRAEDVERSVTGADVRNAEAEEFPAKVIAYAK